MEEVCDTCARDGLWPAMQKFMTLVGIQGGPPADQGEPTPEILEAQAMMQGNMEFFFGRYIRNIARYEPDFAARAAPRRGRGRISRRPRRLQRPAERVRREGARGARLARTR